MGVAWCQRCKRLNMTKRNKEWEYQMNIMGFHGILWDFMVVSWELHGDFMALSLDLHGDFT